MITAFILVNGEKCQSDETINALQDCAGVSELHTTDGKYGLVIVARVTDNAALDRLMADTVAVAPGVEETTLLLAKESISAFELGNPNRVPEK